MSAETSRRVLSEAKCLRGVRSTLVHHIGCRSRVSGSDTIHGVRPCYDIEREILPEFAASLNVSYNPTYADSLAASKFVFDLRLNLERLNWLISGCAVVIHEYTRL